MKMNVPAGSRLERVLSAGHFAVTVEVGPPRGPDPEPIRKKAKLVGGIADAYNVTDNQTAVVRMSSIAGAKILLDEGLEPVMQMTCRDRNRIAIQSDLLGAWALGVRNCLSISGDHQKAGAGGKLQGHPGSKNVYDVDSIQLLAILKGVVRRFHVGSHMSTGFDIRHDVPLTFRTSVLRKILLDGSGLRLQDEALLTRG